MWWIADGSTSWPERGAPRGFCYGSGSVTRHEDLLIARGTSSFEKCEGWNIYGTEFHDWEKVQRPLPRNDYKW